MISFDAHPFDVISQANSLYSKNLYLNHDKPSLINDKDDALHIYQSLVNELKNSSHDVEMKIKY